MKEKAAFDFRFMTAMRAFIWEKTPPATAADVYPELFENSNHENWKVEKAKMQNWAELHNRKIEKERGSKCVGKT